MWQVETFKRESIDSHLADWTRQLDSEDSRLLSSSDEIHTRSLASFLLSEDFNPDEVRCDCVRTACPWCLAHVRICQRRDHLEICRELPVRCLFGWSSYIFVFTFYLLLTITFARSCLCMPIRLEQQHVVCLCFLVILDYNRFMLLNVTIGCGFECRRQEETHHWRECPRYQIKCLFRKAHFLPRKQVLLLTFHKYLTNATFTEQ